MEIYLPVGLNEIGKRSNNEDCIFPSNPSIDDKLFIVCDGVGGQAKGEIASKLVCEFFPKYFLENPKYSNKNSYLENGLRFVEERLKDYIELDPDAVQMATTLTLVHLLDNKVLVGWVGDSRVYHIRNGKILFRTKDHSEVQSLIDMGEISEKEAETHPRKNIITRAISGNDGTRIDQIIIDDLEPNDYFLLCTDGILENLNKSKIKKWFTKHNHPEKIKSAILKDAFGNTKDNFSMHIVKIKTVDSEKKYNFLQSPFIKIKQIITGGTK